MWWLHCTKETSQILAGMWDSLAARLEEQGIDPSLLGSRIADRG